MTEQVDGDQIASEIEEELKAEAECAPKLEIILVGDNPASRTYIHEKLEACNRLGFKSGLTEFPKDVEEKELIQKIEELNQDKKTHGILVQLPLPDQVDNDKIFNTLNPEKDVDGLTPLNLGKTLRGETKTVPAAVKAIEKILQQKETSLEGKQVTIINNSNLIGKPLSMILTEKDATVTLCHKNTNNLGKHTKESDIVITATGEPNVIEKEMVSEDTFLIDAGYESKNTSETEKVKNHVSKISPEPGGVGPITVAMTLKNLLRCYRIQQNS